MEQAKSMETLVRLRLLKNMAAASGPCGQIGDVVIVDAEMARALIEAGGAIEVDFPAPVKEERVEGEGQGSSAKGQIATSPQPSPKGEGAKPATKQKAGGK